MYNFSVCENLGLFSRGCIVFDYGRRIYLVGEFGWGEYFL